MNEKKKIYIMAIIFICVIIIISFVLYNRKERQNYLILPNQQVYELKNDDFQKITQLKKQTFKFLIDKDIREYNVIVDKDKLSILSNFDKIKLDNFKIGYTSNLVFEDYTVKNFDIEDYSAANQVLIDHGISGNINMYLSKKVSFDFDNDGNLETIYFTTNLFDDVLSNNKAFSFGYYIKNDNINYLLEQVDEIENLYDLCVPSINSIVDIDNDKNKELILNCDKFDELGIENYIYKFKDNKFVNLLK